MSFSLDILKDRQNPHRLTVIISAAALIAALALVYFGILPTRARLAAAQQEIEQAKSRLATMQGDIAGTARQRQTTDSIRKAHQSLLDAGLITPLLGSYAMRGKQLLDPLAHEAGFTVDSVKELPPQPIRLPEPPPEQLYARQPVEFTGRGAYTQIVAFVKLAEASLPLATLSSIKILAQPQTPEVHRALIAFEWLAVGEKRQPDTKAKKK